jgi:hypothetical protein
LRFHASKFVCGLIGATRAGFANPNENANRKVPTEAIYGETCGLTAVIAVTDRTKRTAHAALQRAVAERGKLLASNYESRFRDQIRAVEILGGQLFSLGGDRFSATNFPSDRKWNAGWLREQPTIREFLAQPDLGQCPDRLMVHASRPKRDGKGLESHTFTLDRGCYFDNNVKGKPRPLAQAPKELLDMRVIDVVVVRRPRGRPKNPSP